MLDEAPFLLAALAGAINGKPRTILSKLNWVVGDEPRDQWNAALIISGFFALWTLAVYVALDVLRCSVHRRRGVPNSGRSVANTLWTIHNKRYDMNAFVASHPGGADAIALGQGRNCTELFESYHSLANEKLVRATLTRFYVEDAPPGANDYESRFDWQATPFYNELKTRVQAHFKQRGGSNNNHHADWSQWAQLVFFIGASLYTLCRFMCGDLLSMLMLPFCYWWGPSSCMHDGGHFSLSRSPWLNRIFAHIGCAHMSLFAWSHQHTIGHHVHTNIPGCDPDLYHFSIFADSTTPGFRTSIELRTLPESSYCGLLPRFLFWRLGFLFRMPFTTFGPSIIWDALSLNVPEFDRSFLGVVPYTALSIWAVFSHSFGRCIVIWLAVIHPLVICLIAADSTIAGIRLAFVFVIAPYAVHGCLFYMFSQVSHIQHECFTVKVDDSNRSSWHHSHPYGVGQCGNPSIGLCLRAFLRLLCRAVRECLTFTISQIRCSRHKSFTVKVDDADISSSHQNHTFSKLYQEQRGAQMRHQAGHANLSDMSVSLVSSSECAANGAQQSPLPFAEPPDSPVSVWQHCGKPVGRVDHNAVRSGGASLGEWAVHQVEHSFDYSVDSTFWLHISNGLSLQAVHHLFPQVAWCHYTKLGAIVQKVCDEFGVKYSTAPTFWAALRSHWKYLADINDEPLGSVWVPPPAGFAATYALDKLGQLD